FFFQAEDGIRDATVTGVQTCALPIWTPHRGTPFANWGIARFERLLKPLLDWWRLPRQAVYDLSTTACQAFNALVPDAPEVRYFRSEERRVGKECSVRSSSYHQMDIIE